MSTTTKTKKTATKKTTATEELEKEPVSEQADQEKYIAMRTEQRELCGKEIAEILEKYGCELSAQMLITEAQNIPRVVIIDGRERG